MKGMRQNKQPSTKDKIRELEIQLQNMQMAMQMSQMMIKHLTDQFQTFQADLGGTMGMLNDFQYRTLAMLELGGFDTNAIDAKADEYKLNDFNKASDKEDEQKGYVKDENGIVTEDSIVIVTTSTPDQLEDQGIFRSKFPMSECLTPDLREKLLGSKVGDTIQSTIYNVNHDVTILDIKKPLPDQMEVVTDKEESTEE